MEVFWQTSDSFLLKSSMTKYCDITGDIAEVLGEDEQLHKHNSFLLGPNQSTSPTTESSMVCAVLEWMCTWLNMVKDS